VPNIMLAKVGFAVHKALWDELEAGWNPVAGEGRGYRVIPLGFRRGELQEGAYRSNSKLGRGGERGANI